MKRRHWMTAAGALAAAAALPERSSGQAGRGKKAVPPDGLEAEVVRLRLRHTWTTTMSMIYAFGAERNVKWSEFEEKT